MKTITTPTMFGSPTDFPVIDSIVNILNENHNDNTRKYCISTIQEYRVILSTINALKKEPRRYILNLIKLDFIERVNSTKMDEKLKNHMRNLLCSIHNSIKRKI